MIVELIEDGDDLILPLYEHFCEELGWKIGDTIEFTDNKDGTWSMKKQETEIVLVETVSTFKMTYAIEVPKGKAAWALDEVTMEAAVEMAQEHIGEQIFSHRSLTKEEYLKEFDGRNDYLKTWTEEQKLNQVHKL